MWAFWWLGVEALERGSILIFACAGLQTESLGVLEGSAEIFPAPF